MSHVPGTHAEVLPDLITNTVIVHLAEEDSVSTEEVIHYLESEGLAARTRRRVFRIVEVFSEKGIALKLYLRGAWESWLESDITKALQDLFAKRRPLCA